MAVVVDDQWPSLAPIRTSSAATCSLVSCEALNLKAPHRRRCAYSSSINSPFSTGSLHRQISSSPLDQEAAASSPLEEPPDSAADHATDNSTRSSYTSYKPSCMRFFPNCFSRRSMRPACMPRRSPMLRSMVGFPAGGIQVHYLSPTGKAQLSGTIQATSPGKIQQYASPRATPGATAWAQLPGANQQFSGTSPSPRTGSISPSSARRRKAAAGAFTMIPPAMAGKKKPPDYEQPQEPTSPEVTCIGRVRRKTQCQKYFNTGNPHHQYLTFKRKDKVKKKDESQSPKNITDSLKSLNKVDSSCELSSELCTQRYGRKKLHNLHKIHGCHDQLTAEDLPANCVDFNYIQTDSGINSGRKGPTLFADPECRSPSINLTAADLEKRDPMSSMQKADDDQPAMVMNLGVNDDQGTACLESGDDSPTILNSSPPLGYETLDGLQHKSNPLQAQRNGFPPRYTSGDSVSSQSTPPADCLLLMRSSSSRRPSEANTSGLFHA